MGLYYEKFKKSLKRGLKTWNRCNWPELTSYCGCCDLSIGIYIRCVATVVITVASIIFKCFLLLSLIRARKRIRNADMSTLEEFLEEVTDSEQPADLNGVFMILDGVIAYFILWGHFKFFYIVRNVWTIYAVYKKKRRSLKVLLYIGVPCWIFDGCLSIVGALILSYLIKGMLFINFMFEVNLLAIHSKYKEISGKSRIVKDIGITSEIIRPHIISTETPVDTRSEPHCITCKCFVRHNNNCPHVNNDVNNFGVTPIAAALTIPTNMWPVTLEASSSTENKSEETLNFKDSPIIFNQDILQGVHRATPTSPTNEEDILRDILYRPEKSTTLATRPIIVVKEEKTDLCDTPVIYDERRFDVGTSPIVERV